MKKIAVNLLKKYWPIILLIVVWIFFSYPYLFKGLVPFPSRYLVDFFSPWNNIYGLTVKNNAMPDVLSQQYPWKLITIDTLKQSEIPRWNPYQFAGTPHLADYQSAVFSPLNILFFMLPFLEAWSIMVLLQPILAGIFMYLFTRSISISRVGALISSISFMFCGFITVWMAYGTLGYAIAYLPLLLFGITKYFKKPHFFYVLVITFSITASFVSGHFQTSIYLLFTGIGYVVFLSIINRNLINGMMALLYMICGIIFALPQIIPTLLLFQHSVRSSYFGGVGGIPFNYLVTILSPDFYGNPVTRNDWRGYYAEFSSFSGTATVFLGLVAVLYQKHSRYIRYFFLLLLISFIGSVASPLLLLIEKSHIPFFSTVSASRAIVISSFSIAVLAGFSIDILRKIWSKRNYPIKHMLLYSIGFMFVVAVIWIALMLKLFPINTANVSIDIFGIAKRNMIIPTLLIFSSSGLVLAGSLINKKFITIIPFILLVIVSFDMLKFSSKWMPFDERDYMYPEMPLLTYLKNNTEYERVYQNLKGEAVMAFKLYGIEGYDPLYIQRYGEIARAVTNGEFINAERSVVTVPNNGEYIHSFLDFIGVKYIVHSKQDKKASWIVPVWEEPETYRSVYEDEIYEVFENTDRYPRAYVVYDYEVIEDDKLLLSEFFSNGDLLRSKVLLEEEPKLNTKDDRCSSVTNEVTIQKYSPNNVIIEVQTDCNGILVLTDNYYSDWKVTINNSKGKIFRADYSFRGIEISAGKSIVRFSI